MVGDYSTNSKATERQGKRWVCEFRISDVGVGFWTYMLDGDFINFHQAHLSVCLLILSQSRLWFHYNQDFDSKFRQTQCLGSEIKAQTDFSMESFYGIKRDQNDWQSNEWNLFHLK